MPDAPGAASEDGVFEALQRQQQQVSYTRRVRPSDLILAIQEENKVPLRAQTEKLHRRKSRLALTGLFTRNKPDSQHGSEVGGGSQRGDNVGSLASRPAGIRASLAGISNWPYGLHGQKSETALASHPLSQASDKLPQPNASLKHKKSTSSVKPQPSQRPLATWDPPPLFKAYPQAIKHTRLPACTLSAEAILKLHGQKGALTFREGLNQSSANLESIEELPGAERTDKFTRRRHRRNHSGSSFNLDWTTKIYVLATSGYLLQYAGEGSFDRQPEKVLHIGKDSAAFASDVIPGRHWVLQVSSVADPAGAASLHASSVFSRLPFRSVERRNASTFLMVFESADDMDSWIATIRREIEALGGKKNLSETGKPKVDESDLQVRTQFSQRALVVRDPARFSRRISQELPWQNGGLPGVTPDIHLEPSDYGTRRDQSFDETSTASGVSQDGRQLDGLRDSTNRLSIVSSGQRTMVTSAASSPACSPTRDSFASQPDDDGLRRVTPPPDLPLLVHPRPNASAIAERRQSMQAANHVLEMRCASQIVRPHSTSYTSASWQENSRLTNIPIIPDIPNFSVPKSLGKRYSLGKHLLSPDEIRSTSPGTQRQSASKPLRKPPPSAISINPRPLSLVEDQPSSGGSSLPSHDAQQSPRKQAVGPGVPSHASLETHELGSQHSERQISDSTRNTVNSVEIPARSSPRKQAYMSTIRPSRRGKGSKDRSHAFVVLQDSELRAAPSTTTWNSNVLAEMPRSKSSMDNHTMNRSPPRDAVHHKQQSLSSPISDVFPRYSMAESDMTVTTIDSQDLLSRPNSPGFKALAPIPRRTTANQHLGLDAPAEGVGRKRSMSRLADGPPPAPPPTCALPPIPRKAS
ncbi:hypothetical protein VTK73DRAFT_1046 [Phialemonium thermophilum]|uniref:PH domain-containing protein n=1 Tax=Phialemonium thermophilum TaxID=223376 RepID=A0ABR3XBT0_9PEZI